MPSRTRSQAIEGGHQPLRDQAVHGKGGQPSDNESRGVILQATNPPAPPTGPMRSGAKPPKK
jgi:hypothetical protein